MEIGSLKRNSAAIEAGEWVSDIPNAGNLRLKVRGRFCQAAVKLEARLRRNAPPTDRERDGALTPDAETRILRTVLHEAILMDWDGLTDGGTPVAFDREIAGQWLHDPEYDGFGDAVNYAAQVVQRGHVERQSANEKNSQARSRGTSNGPAAAPKGS